MSQPPVALDRYIQLSTNDKLAIADVKAWFHCVEENSPSGVIKTVTIIDDAGSPHSVALVHCESETRHHYRVPLSRALSNKEVGAIAKCFAKLTNFDFDVDTNETSLSAQDRTGISLDAARHLALCTALAKQKHEDWVRERTDSGWRFGMEFDAEEKTHPLIRPWDQLPDRYKKPDMSWPQKLIAMLDDQGYAVIQKEDLNALLKNMRIAESASYTPPVLDVGDTVKVGKFKNRKAEITGFKTDDHQQPVLKTTKGDQKLFKPRIAKLDI